MSTLHHEALLETCYEEAWEDYIKEHNLTPEVLDQLDPKTSLTYQFIEMDARRRFEDMCQ